MKCPKCDTENTQDSQFCKKCATSLTGGDDAQPSFTRTLETPVEALTRGTLFADRYEIIEELGRGGMGAVYRVEDTKAKEEIALKLIKPEIAANKKTIERFRNELTTARKIRHKNICGMYDLNEKTGTHYITMEYIPGQDLKSLIRQTGQLAIPTAISIARQVCDGLTEAHQLGIIHRDLKPANIMIDKNGNARIMDFGIARTLASKGITGAGVMIGTPEYMSPEQAEVKGIDQRSDIYSLGVILYEMVTGQLPFMGDTPLAVALKHKGEIPKDPRELNPQIPENLTDVILQCLEKDKENRYLGAADVRSELNKIETEIPTAERISPKRKTITSKEITVTFGLRKLLIPAIAFIVLATALLIFFMNRGPDLDPKLIVVADFENKTGDESLDTIGPMTADWIRQGLARTGVVRVVPTSITKTDSKGDRGEDRIRSLAKDTGAGTVVSGTYYLQGETISFQSQITDIGAGKLLSSLDSVSGPVKDPGIPIESLRQQLMGTLAIVFDPTIGGFLDYMGHRPPKYEAYQEYLEGLMAWGVDSDKVLEHFSRASELDKTFLIPVLHAAVVHGNRREFDKAEALSREVEKSREKLTKSDLYWLDWLQARIQGDYFGRLRAARQSVLLYPSAIWLNQLGMDAMDNNFPQEAIEAFVRIDVEKEGKDLVTWHLYWGKLTRAYHMLGKYRQELKAARRGRKQYPDLISTLYYEARALVALGKIDAMYQRLDQCSNLPFQRGWSPGTAMRNTSRWLHVHGYKEDALKVAERAIAYYRSRNDSDIRFSLAESFYLAERWEEAEELFKTLRDESSNEFAYLGHLGTTAARLGNREEAIRISKELGNIDLPYTFGNYIYWQACIASLLGEKERAVVLLRDAMAQGVSYTRLLPDFDLEPLWDYPAFKELIKPKG